MCEKCPANEIDRSPIIEYETKKQYQEHVWKLGCPVILRKQEICDPEETGDADRWVAIADMGSACVALLGERAQGQMRI